MEFVETSTESTIGWFFLLFVLLCRFSVRGLFLLWNVRPEDFVRLWHSLIGIIQQEQHQHQQHQHPRKGIVLTRTLALQRVLLWLLSSAATLTARGTYVVWCVRYQVSPVLEYCYSSSIILVRSFALCWINSSTTPYNTAVVTAVSGSTSILVRSFVLDYFGHKK